MKKYTDTIHLTSYTSKSLDLYLAGQRFAVFDIETTGLSPTQSQLILSGFLLVEDDCGQVIQFFADQPGDERAVLAETLAMLRRLDYVITYNGRRFDLPFVTARARRHRLTPADPYDLDLYQIVSRFSPLRQLLPSLSQKALEHYCGLSDGRDDAISGGESVALYDRYLQTHRLDLERQILLHNHDDVIQLYRLLPVLTHTDLHRAFSSLGFPAGAFRIRRVRLAERALCVEALQQDTPVDYIAFPTEAQPYTLRMDAASRQALLTIPCTARGDALYLDAQTILGADADALPDYPAFVNGYLIVAEGGRLHYPEIHLFLRAFFDRLSR